MTMQANWMYHALIQGSAKRATADKSISKKDKEAVPNVEITARK